MARAVTFDLSASVLMTDGAIKYHLCVSVRNSYSECMNFTFVG